LEVAKSSKDDAFAIGRREHCPLADVGDRLPLSLGPVEHKVDPRGEIACFDAFQARTGGRPERSLWPPVAWLA